MFEYTICIIFSWEAISVEDIHDQIIPEISIFSSKWVNSCQKLAFSPKISLNLSSRLPFPENILQRSISIGRVFRLALDAECSYRLEWYFKCLNFLAVDYINQNTHTIPIQGIFCKCCSSTSIKAEASDSRDKMFYYHYALLDLTANHIPKKFFDPIQTNNIGIIYVEALVWCIHWG